MPGKLFYRSSKSFRFLLLKLLRVLQRAIERGQSRNRSLSGDGEKVVTLETARTLGVPQLSLTLEGRSKGF
jgi:hypothetical protein